MPAADYTDSLKAVGAVSVIRTIQRVFAFVWTVVGICVSAFRVLATEDPSAEWYLADGRSITQEDVIWLLAAHRQAVANYPGKGKIEDYWQPLKGAYLHGANFAVLLRKAEERWPVPGAIRDRLERLDLSDCTLVDADFRQLSLRLINLNGANLTRANFSSLGSLGLDHGWLENAELTDADFTGFRFHSVEAGGAFFLGTKLSRTNFTRVDLRQADFQKAVLDGASFDEGSLMNASFSNASLRHVTFSGVKINGAKFDNADVTGLRWDAQGIPDVRTLNQCRNLELLKYDRFETPLLQLRKALADAGLRSGERKMNYALQRSRLDHLWDEGSEGRGWSIWDRGEVMFQKIFFEWPSRFGLDTGKPLRWLLILMLGCCPIYFMALVKRGTWPRAGIWAIRSPDAVRLPAKTRPVRVHLDLRRKMGVFRKLRAIRRAIALTFFFSLQSSFTLGYKDFNVGAWIARLQAREYQLRATGWVRTVVGAQSLISVYLLALWLLTYFGRPFE